MLAPAGYYAIVDVAPSELDGAGAGTATLLARAAQLLAAHPCCLQLRAKGAGGAALAAAARVLMPLARAAGVPFCVNDRMDVALAVGADAVHLGQDDLPLADALVARARAGRPDLTIGLSTHNRTQAVAAVAGGADYIGLGPVFGTASKENPDPTVGLLGLAEICREIGIPIVAIGGITLDRAPAVAATGASAAAVIAAVATAPDPTAAGRRIAAAFGR